MEAYLNLHLMRLRMEHFSDLVPLHLAYKAEIGEEAPTETELDRLRDAMQTGSIVFYGAFLRGKLVGCCSVVKTYSTFCYGMTGVFDDFFILPAFRHHGIAGALVNFAYIQSAVDSLTVGCADCDVGMYRHLSFHTKIGNLLARF